MFPTRQSVQNKLLEGLNSQRLAGKFCDLKLSIGNASFPIHSSVFALFSPEIFEKQETSNKFMARRSFKNPWKFDVSVLKPVDNNTSTTQMEFVNCSACASRVVEFMYRGKIQIPKDHLSHVEAISDRLQLSELGLICKKFGEKIDDQPLAKHSDDQSLTKSVTATAVTDLPPNSENAITNQKPIANTGTCNDKPRRPKRTKPISRSTTKNYYFPDLISKEQKRLKRKMKRQKAKGKRQKAKRNVPRVCTKCELTFTNAAQLQEHRETHLGKLSTCYTCKYSSRKTLELLKHIMEANHNECVCSLCMHESDTPYELKQHIELHNHPKPFFCAICNQRFSSRTGLKFHAPKHSTNTPYCCSVCQRGFKWKHNLQSHLVVHTTEKKHLCEQCGFSTAHKSTFNAHELGHTGHTFKCPEAGCKFKAVSKRNLTVHVATHTKEKPYQCEKCGQHFSQAKNLRRHALKHNTDVNLYNCPVCIFKTMRFDKLKEHCEKRHPKCDTTKLLPLKKKNVTGIASKAGDVPISQPTPVPLELKKNSLPVLESGKCFFVNLVPITALANYANCISLETQVLNLTTADTETEVMDLTTTEILQPSPEPN